MDVLCIRLTTLLGVPSCARFCQQEFVEFPRLVGRYCSYLLPKQAGGTIQILIFKTLQMTGRPTVYKPCWPFLNCHYNSWNWEHFSRRMLDQLDILQKMLTNDWKRCPAPRSRHDHRLCKVLIKQRVTLFHSVTSSQTDSAQIQIQHRFSTAQFRRFALGPFCFREATEENLGSSLR